MTIAAINSIAPLDIQSGVFGGIQPSPQNAHSGVDFAGMVDGALNSVSLAQQSAQPAEQGYAIGAPGATLGKAVVSSDRAEVAWNAAVAVRNEVVSAYSSIMNLPF